MQITYGMIEEGIKKGYIQVEKLPVDGALICTIADHCFCLEDELAWRPAEDYTKEFEIKLVATRMYDELKNVSPKNYHKYWDFLLNYNIGADSTPSIDNVLEDAETRSEITKQRNASNHQSTTVSETDGSPDNGNIQIGGQEMEEDLDL